MVDGFASALGSGSALGLGSVLGLESREPICSEGLYFLRMPSLWYFQNCFDASLPATRVKIFLPPTIRRQTTVYGGVPYWGSFALRFSVAGAGAGAGLGHTWVVVLELG